MRKSKSNKFAWGCEMSTVEEIKISQVPMLTVDECEIHLNSVLYTAEWKSGYNWDGTAGGSVEAHRVISVNQAARFFRTRCEKGCETEHRLAGGCSRKQYFGTFINALKQVISYAERDLNAGAEKISKIESARENIGKELRRVKKTTSLELKIPKPVK